MDESLVSDYVNSEQLIKNQNIMPQNLEAEQSLIGSLLFDNKILEQLPSLISYFISFE